MVTSLIEQVGAWIISVISHGGYAGIVVLMSIESACIPLPSEIIMPFAGFLAGVGRFRLGWVSLAGAIGCNLGSAVAYFVGARGGRPLAEKYGQYVLISRHDLELADRFSARYGDPAVFLGRLLPIIRTFIALPAGISRMNFVRFNIFTFLGSLPWCWVLAFAGMKLGSHWTVLRGYFHRFDEVVGAFIVLGIVWFVWNHLKNRVRA